MSIDPDAPKNQAPDSFAKKVFTVLVMFAIFLGIALALTQL